MCAACYWPQHYQSSLCHVLGQLRRVDAPLLNLHDTLAIVDTAESSCVATTTFKTGLPFCDIVKFSDLEECCVHGLLGSTSEEVRG